MNFNSLDFILLAVVFFAAWPVLRSQNKVRLSYLVVVSFIFYGWWNWKYLLPLIGMGLSDYLAALGMVRWPGKKKLFLILSLLSNICLLLVFKYLNFAIDNLNFFFSLLGVTSHLSSYELILPLGISFYTFQAMSYVLDVYHNKVEPTRNITHFFAYLSLFPHILAGPIIRASDLLPQLQNKPNTTWTMLWSGTLLIAQGLAKKMLIADNLAPVVMQAFSSAVPESSALYWWLIMIMFSFQIYGDFSGYTDIARGLANLMGYAYPVNFNHPYCATSFRDFWLSWHISLSSWFRDYVYIPLGGNKAGKIRSHVNMWITMLISGLWHGASWTFVAWGAVHAAYISVERETRWNQKTKNILGTDWLNMVFVFILVLLAWVFFRAQSVRQATDILLIMFTQWQNTESAITLFLTQYKAFMVLLFAFAGEITYKAGVRRLIWVDKTSILWEPIAVAFAVLLAILFRGPGNEFIYFQF